MKKFFDSIENRAVIENQKVSANRGEVYQRRYPYLNRCRKLCQGEVRLNGLYLQLGNKYNTRLIDQI